MNFIPQIFYRKSITSLIYQHLERGIIDYDELTQSDREILSAECFKELGSDAYEALLDDSDLSGFSKFLATGDIDTAYTILENMKKSTIKYFDVFLKPLFEEMLEEYTHQIIDGRKHIYYEKGYGYVEGLRDSSR